MVELPAEYTDVHQIYANKSCGIKIFIAKSLSLNQIVVCKMIECSSEADVHFYQREGRIAESLKHPSICKIIDQTYTHVGSRYQYCIVMERAHSDLYKESKKRKFHSTPWTEDSIFNILEQAVDALEFAQKRQVCHRDIKPHNILINNDGRVKLADFGSANEEIKSNIVQTLTLQGTPMYLSPELRTYYSDSLSQRRGKPRYDPYKSDVYSLGLTIINLLDLDPPVKLAKLENLDQTVRVKIEGLVCSGVMKEILVSMLAREIEMRPDFVMLKKLITSVKYKGRSQLSLQPLSSNYFLDPNEPRSPREPESLQPQVRVDERVQEDPESKQQDLGGDLEVQEDPFFNESIKSNSSFGTNLSRVTEKVAEISLAVSLSDIACSITAAPGPEPPAGTCVNCTADLGPGFIQLPCEHSICTSVCLRMLLLAQTKFFTLDVSEVLCPHPTCGNRIGIQVLERVKYDGHSLVSIRNNAHATYLCQECRRRDREVKLILPSCEHKYCKQCVTGWQIIARRNGGRISCPICKHDLTGKDVEELVRVLED